MGNLCCARKRKRNRIVVLLIGLDNAGKTVAVRGLAGEPTDSVVPTVGFSIIHLKHLQYSVDIFDLGGGPSIRGIWDKYFVDAHGIIFVIDSSDVDRLGEVKSALENVLSHEKVSGKPMLILANKQDNEYALDEVDLVERLQLEELVNKQQCPTLVECCAATVTGNKTKVDPGIKTGYNWLLSYIVANYEPLNSRVEEDTQRQRELDKQILAEKIERIKIQKQRETNNDEDAIESYSEYTKKTNRSIFNKKLMANKVGVVDSSKLPQSSSSNNGHIFSHYSVEQRPKSATQAVRQHLLVNAENESAAKVRVSNKKVVQQNKKKMSHSADMRRKDVGLARRNLRSAGDSVFVINTALSVHVAGPSGDDFEMTNFGKFPSASNHITKTNVPFNNDKLSNGQSQGITMVDIE